MLVSEVDLGPFVTAGDFDILVPSPSQTIIYTANGLAFLEGGESITHPVAIKSARPHLVNSVTRSKIQRRFAREVRMHSMCDHSDYIPTVFLNGAAADVPYIGMELVKGKDLSRVIFDMYDQGSWKPKPLTLPQIIQIGLDIAYGINDISNSGEKGVVHADLKPDNVLMPPEGLIKIGDLELAVETDELNRGGNARYLSPEQVQDIPLDTLTDIYAWGNIMYEILAGGPPIQGSGSDEIKRKILAHERPKVPQRKNLQIPEAFAKIIEKAYARNPQDRYQNAQDLIIDLLVVREKYGSTMRVPNYIP